MKKYRVEAMLTGSHIVGAFGPFSIVDRAEECVLRLSERTGILSAEITEIEKKDDGE